MFIVPTLVVICIAHYNNINLYILYVLNLINDFNNYNFKITSYVYEKFKDFLIYKDI